MQLLTDVVQTERSAEIPGNKTANRFKSFLVPNLDSPADVLFIDLLNDLLHITAFVCQCIKQNRSWETTFLDIDRQLGGDIRINRFVVKLLHFFVFRKG